MRALILIVTLFNVSFAEAAASESECIKNLTAARELTAGEGVDPKLRARAIALKEQIHREFNERNGTAISDSERAAGKELWLLKKQIMSDAANEGAVIEYNDEDDDGKRVFGTEFKWIDDWRYGEFRYTDKNGDEKWGWSSSIDVASLAIQRTRAGPRELPVAKASVDTSIWMATHRTLTPGEGISTKDREEIAEFSDWSAMVYNVHRHDRFALARAEQWKANLLAAILSGSENIETMIEFIDSNGNKVIGTFQKFDPNHKNRNLVYVDLRTKEIKQIHSSQIDLTSFGLRKNTSAIRSTLEPGEGLSEKIREEVLEFSGWYAMVYNIHRFDRFALAKAEQEKANLLTVILSENKDAMIQFNDLSGNRIIGIFQGFDPNHKNRNLMYTDLRTNKVESIHSSKIDLKSLGLRR